MRLYLQGDPRGCPIYLVPEEAIPTDREAIAKDFTYPSDKDKAPSLTDLQSRWISSHYPSRGVAFCHIGR